MKLNLESLRKRGSKKHGSFRKWCAAAGVNPSTFWRWAQGHSSPTLSKLMKMQEASRG
jgi:transcriptional regulator with XRE-family HTH domain